MKKGAWLCILVFSIVHCAFAGVTQPEDFTLTSHSGVDPVLLLPFDAGGYSDWWIWGESPRHYYGRHELLSGEWAAAIYYDGIETSPIDPNDSNSAMQAMWLTDVFSYPTWWTNSTFSKNGDSDCWFDDWNDPNNEPESGINTAQSIIINHDGRVKVTIRLRSC